MKIHFATQRLPILVIYPSWLSGGGRENLSPHAAIVDNRSTTSMVQCIILHPSNVDIWFRKVYME